MDATFQPSVDWRKLFAKPGFPFLFTGMFVSLFGTGLNFAGTTWYVFEKTGSTVATAMITVFVTVPGLFVPPFGGVLIDRVDRRYLGIALDLIRGATVLGAALLLAFGRGEIWHIFLMTFLLGAGFSIYWSTTHALIQEITGRADLVAANSAVLIAVQGGMMAAGAVVGFLYKHIHLSGILTMDAVTYMVAAFCLLRLRSGYHAPHAHADEAASAAQTPAAETAGANGANDASNSAPAHTPGDDALLPFAEPEPDRTFISDLREGLRYLRANPPVMALGFTYAFLMAGVLSGNTLIVALTMLVLKAGATGFGYMEAGWALGAVAGGFTMGEVVRRHRPANVMVFSLAVLALGHAAFPLVTLLSAAVVMQILFGWCRAMGGVLTQSSIMTVVPKRLMGRTQSAFSVIATILQVVMSFAVGVLAEKVSLPVAFGTLGALYGCAVLAALRVRRDQMRPAPAAQPAT